jgi:hypothetical protein
MPDLQKIYRIELDSIDLGQLLDDLDIRAEAWEKTAFFHRTGESPSDIIVEERRDAQEAGSIATHYRSIIEKIEKQKTEQDRSGPRI